MGGVGVAVGEVGGLALDHAGAGSAIKAPVPPPPGTCSTSDLLLFPRG